MLERRKQRSLEKRRGFALLAIGQQRSEVEATAELPREPGDPLDSAFVAGVLKRLQDCEAKAVQSTSIDELDDLIGEAEQQGQLRAYIYPAREIYLQATLDIDLMKEWNVPQAVIDRLRLVLIPKLEHPHDDLASARSALRSLFEERDSWENYTNDYDDTMSRYARDLLVVTIIVLSLAVAALYWHPALVAGILLAGAAGSCISVMTKLPVLEVRPSGELDAYIRVVLIRTATGIAASLIGCALLGWGLLSISIKNQSFADVLTSCEGGGNCGTLNKLILLAVPILFGFSERALASFEGVFGNLSGKHDRKNT